MLFTSGLGTLCNKEKRRLFVFIWEGGGGAVI